MRILLRNTSTDRFFLDDETWTPDASSARNFKTSAAACLFLHEHRLAGTEIVLWFDDPRFNVALPAYPPSSPA